MVKGDWELILEEVALALEALDTAIPRVAAYVPLGSPDDIVIVLNSARSHVAGVASLDVKPMRELKVKKDWWGQIV